MNLTQIKDKIVKIKNKLPRANDQLVRSLKVATALVIPVAMTMSIVSGTPKVEARDGKIVTAMPLKLNQNIFQLASVGKAQIVVAESEAERKDREAKEAQEAKEKAASAKTYAVASASRPVEDVKAYAYDLVSSRWGISEWGAFDYIVGRESGWNWQARNSRTGAYGLGQAYPASKMGELGNTPEGQVQWVVAYIAGRYGSPSSAHQFWVTHGWY